MDDVSYIAMLPHFLTQFFHLVFKHRADPDAATVIDPFFLKVPLAEAPLFPYVAHSQNMQPAPNAAEND